MIGIEGGKKRDRQSEKNSITEGYRDRYIERIAPSSLKEGAPAGERLRKGGKGRQGKTFDCGGRGARERLRGEERREALR